MGRVMGCSFLDERDDGKRADEEPRGSEENSFDCLYHGMILSMCALVIIVITRAISVNA
jgi:hypothetical protein